MITNSLEIHVLDIMYRFIIWGYPFEFQFKRIKNELLCDLLYFSDFFFKFEVESKSRTNTRLRLEENVSVKLIDNLL